MFLVKGMENFGRIFGLPEDPREIGDASVAYTHRVASPVEFRKMGDVPLCSTGPDELVHLFERNTDYVLRRLLGN